jgi:hypothetical protein
MMATAPLPWAGVTGWSQTCATRGTHRSRLRALALAAALFAISSCASQQTVTGRTAGVIGVPPDQVTISNFTRGTMDFYRWKATTPSGEYNCWGDYMRRNVWCTPVTPENE